MQKTKPGSNTVHRFLSDSDVFSFASNVKVTPACWKNVLSEVLAMVKGKTIRDFHIPLNIIVHRSQMG